MSAATCALLLHLLAAHAQPGFHAETPGLGVLCERGQGVAAAGAFRNSEGGSSRYVAAGWQPLELGPVRLGAVAGVIDGYAYRGGNPMPFAAGLVSVPLWRGVEARFLAVPHVEGVSAAALQLAVSIPIGGRP